MKASFLRKFTLKEEILNLLSIFSCFLLFIIGIWTIEKGINLFTIIVSTFFFFTHQKLTSEWLHEAAHWGICSSKHLNDRIANIFLAPFFLVSIKSYRFGHFEHHKQTEYFNGIDAETSNYIINSNTNPFYLLLRTFTGSALVYSLFDVLSKNYIIGKVLDTKTKKEFISIFTTLIILPLFTFVLINNIHLISALSLYSITFLCFYTPFTFNRTLEQHGGSIHNLFMYLKFCMDKKKFIVKHNIDQAINLTGPSNNDRNHPDNFFSKFFLATDVMRFHETHHKYPNLTFRQCKSIAFVNH